MKKITALTLTAVFLTFGLALAQQTPATGASATQLVEVGNKHCPVSGREVGVMGPAFKLEYKGKIYNLCCPGCKSIFLANPEKYSAIAQGQVNTAKAN